MELCPGVLPLNARVFGPEACLLRPAPIVICSAPYSHLLGAFTIEAQRRPSSSSPEQQYMVMHRWLFSIAADSSGHGHLSWTAITIDQDKRVCGHNDKANLNDGDAVNVHADGDCNT